MCLLFIVKGMDHNVLDGGEDYIDKYLDRDLANHKKKGKPYKVIKDEVFGRWEITSVQFQLKYVQGKALSFSARFSIKIWIKWLRILGISKYELENQYKTKSLKSREKGELK